MPMLLGDDERADSYARVQFWTGFVRGLVLGVAVCLALTYFGWGLQ